MKPDPKRVEAYVDSWRIDQRVKRGRRLSARVHGSMGLYRVHADLEERDSWGCTCPSSYRPCKHVEALRKTYQLRPRTFVDLDQKLRKLRGRSTVELVEVVGKIIADHPAAIGSLGVRGFSRKSEWTEEEYHQEEAPDE